MTKVIKCEQLANNQLIIKDDFNNKHYLQSYDSTVVLIDFDRLILIFGRDYNYSRTTSKYVMQFLHKYNINIATMQDLKKYIDKEFFIDNCFRDWTIKYDFNLI